MSETSLHLPPTHGTFQLPPDARLVRRSSQELGLQITVHEGHAAFIQSYVLGDRFGGGGFGHVHLARRVTDNRVVVVKEIRSDRVPCWCQLDDKLMPIEVVLLAMCQNIPGIVQFFDAYNLGQSWVLVMDRVSEATCDMFDYIGERGTLPEVETAHYFHQLIGILLACHEAGVLHRDIKDENILINRSTNELVLIDFGSGAFLESRLYTDFDGTRVYCPPEWILSNSYDGKQAEVWSLGVLLYDMLCGDIPFLNDKGITSGKLRYRKDNLSKAAKDLIGSCLSMDPNKRPTLMEILNHPWMTQHRPIRHDKQPGALLAALRALEETTFTTGSLLDVTASQPPMAFCSTSAHSRPHGANAFSSIRLSYSSPSPSVDKEPNHDPQKFTCSNFATDSRLELITPALATSENKHSHEFPHSVNTDGSMRCLTRPSDVPPISDLPTPVSTSSPIPAYIFWSDELDSQYAPNVSPSLNGTRPVSEALHAIPQFTVPTSVSPCPRVHSNESSSSSGYYSRSDSLSSNEGHHLMTTTILNASRTCSTSNHPNSLMSVSHVTTAHATSKPCSTTMTTTHPVPQLLRDAAQHTLCWRSGSAGVTSYCSSTPSSSSSPLSNKSTPPDSKTINRIPTYSIDPEQRHVVPTSAESNPSTPWSLSSPCRKNNTTMFYSNSASATTTTNTTNSSRSSYPITSTNSNSQPSLLPPVSDGVDKFYKLFNPATTISFRAAANPHELSSWFVSSSSTSRG